MRRLPITVSETPEFQRQAERLLGAKDLAALIDHLARHPETGVIIEGTSGLRKLRWSRPGMGKRGGARVIYYFQDQRFPVLLLTVYAKSGKDDLSAAERSAMKAVVEALKKARSERWTKSPRVSSRD